jgi:uncharacterized protein (DUF1778 family)
MGVLKEARIAARLPLGQAALIRAAAELEGSTVTEFTVGAALARAHDVLAEQRLFSLDDANWVEFLAVLDRPVADKPRLEALFAEGSIFE